MTSKSSPHTSPPSANKPLEEHLQGLELHLQDLQSQLDHIQSAKAYQVWQNMVPLKHSLVKVISDPAKIPKALKLLFKQGPAALLEKAISVSHADEEIQSVNDQYQVWFQNNYPTAQDLDTQRQKATTFKHKPLISIITPTYNTPIKYLRECIESVINQSYPNWELCLADDCSPDPEVRKVIKEYASMDKRVKYVFRKTNGHISRASNSALKLAKGEWVGLLDHDDVLWPNALYEVVKTINEKPKAQVIYSDEDKIAEDGKTHCDPFFKPDWSPTYLRTINYITHFTLSKHSLFKTSGGFRTDVDGAQDWDIILRITDFIRESGNERDKIQHIPTVLYSWRKSSYSTASEKHTQSAKPYAYVSQKKVLQYDKNRHNYHGNVRLSMGSYYFEPHLSEFPKVSIIIPSKNHTNLIRRCIKSIIDHTTYTNYEIILVDTGSTDLQTMSYYTEITQKKQRIYLHRWKEPFNYSAVCNYGVSKSSGEYLIFLNNDTEVISADWIENMLFHASQPRVGAVGAKLLYADHTIQHAGVTVGLTGFAGHLFQGQLDGDAPHFPFGKQIWTRNVLAVTAACMMVRTSLYEEAGGLSEKMQICGNDVDFCLKLYEMGYDNVIVAESVLYHHESQTRDPNKIPINDFICSLDSYSKYLKNGDPYFNPNLSYWSVIPKIKIHKEVAPYVFAQQHIQNNASSQPLESKEFPSLQLSSLQEEALFVAKTFDYTSLDINKNKQLLLSYKSDIQIQTVNWFIPDFTTIFAGITNIFNFAVFLASKGISSRFIIDSHNNPSSIRDLVYREFTSLKNSQFYSIKSRHIPSADVGICTLWTTAYHLLHFNKVKRKIYFIQDHEVLFYPSGTTSALVENTYRFGFPAITNFEFLEQIYKNDYHSPAFTLRSRVDLNRFLTVEGTKQKKVSNVFFYARPQHPRNGFELGLESLRKLKSELGSQVNIVTAGSEWSPKQFNLDGKVTNLGIIPLSKLPSFYAGMDVGLFLMFSAHPGVIPFELMASGCPVVINRHNVPGWTDLYQHKRNCIISEPTASEIARNILMLLNNQQLREAIIYGGKTTVEKAFHNYDQRANMALKFIIEHG